MELTRAMPERTAHDIITAALPRAEHDAMRSTAWKIVDALRRDDYWIVEAKCSCSIETGPEEDCPIHGRPADWLWEQLSKANEALTRVRVLAKALAGSRVSEVITTAELIELTIDGKHECVHDTGLCYGVGTPGHAGTPRIPDTADRCVCGMPKSECATRGSFDACCARCDETDARSHKL